MAPPMSAPSTGVRWMWPASSPGPARIASGMARKWCAVCIPMGMCGGMATLGPSVMTGSGRTSRFNDVPTGYAAVLLVPFSLSDSDTLFTTALVGFARSRKARHPRQATTGSQFVTAPKFGSGPSDFALRRTPCHCCLPHLNELTCTGQTFTDKNCDLPVAPGPVALGHGNRDEFYALRSNNVGPNTVS